MHLYIASVRNVLRRVVFALLPMYGMLPCLAQKQGQPLVDSLLAELQHLRPDTNRAKLLIRTGFELSTINPAEGTKYARAGLRLSQELGWRKGMGNGYNILGICALDASDYKLAREHWAQATNIFSALRDTVGLLKVIGNLGNIFTAQGDYPRALQQYFLALRYAEAIGDEYSAGLNLGNIGSTFESLKDFDKALTYDFKALHMYKALKDTASTALTLCNIGNLYSDKKQFAAAARFLQQALAYDRRIGYTESIARDMQCIGSNLADSGAYRAALSWYFDALKLAETAGQPLLTAKNYYYIGESLLAACRDSAWRKPSEVPGPADGAVYSLPQTRQKLLNETVSYLKKAISISTEISAEDVLFHCYRLLSEAQTLQGTYHEALDSYKKYMALNDSVYSNESNAQIARLETQRELELKDKQIIIDRLAVEKKRNERVLFGAGFLLLLIVVVIIVRNIRLSTAKELSENKLNALQSRMNPHFIFNSLSSIQSLILNDEKEQSMDYLSEFSTLMRQILDSSGQSKVSLKAEIDMLRSYVELEHLRFDGFERNITVAEDINEESIDVPGMVVQPFVENAILHGLVSKGMAGKLDIAFERRDKHIICTVEDNGVGRAASAEINAKRARKRQSHGTSIATARLTMLNDKKRGLVNTVTYIDKMEGGIAAGTKVIIELPVL